VRRFFEPRQLKVICKVEDGATGALSERQNEAYGGARLREELLGGCEAAPRPSISHYIVSDISLNRQH
jgi:hypothetical protein